MVEVGSVFQAKVYTIELHVCLHSESRVSLLGLEAGLELPYAFNQKRPAIIL